MQSPLRIAALALSALALSVPCEAQCRTERLSPSDPLSGNRFGAAALAVDGDTIAVGAPRAAGGGAVYVFRRTPTGWSEEARLAVTDPRALRLGASVALRGDTLLAGAPLWGEADPTASLYSAGAVFVFERAGTSWTHVGVIFPWASAWAAQFGASLAFDGARLAVGAPEEEQSNGRVHVFERAAGVWSQLATLAPMTSLPLQFGSDVAVEGGTLLASAPLEQGAGAVYWFQESGSGWPFVTRIDPPHPSPGDRFGAGLVLDGELAAWGALEDGAGVDSGGAYVYRRAGSAWVLEAELHAPVPQALERFGSVLALEDGRLVAGGTRDAAYVFAEDGGAWRFAHGLRVPPGDPMGVEFGVRVASDGLTDLVGTDPAAGPEAAYVFDAGTPLGLVYCGANASSTGVAAGLAATGSTRVTDACLVLRARELPPGTYGFFLASMHQGSVPLFGGGQGELCLGLPIVRFDAHVLRADGSGRVSFALDFAALPQQTVFQAGETWNFQMWFRDRNPGPTSNATPGLAIPLE